MAKYFYYVNERITPKMTIDDYANNIDKRIHIGAKPYIKTVGEVVILNVTYCIIPKNGQKLSIFDVFVCLLVLQLYVANI